MTPIEDILTIETTELRHELHWMLSSLMLVILTHILIYWNKGCSLTG
ncbi:hypothetical protein ES703_64411 [subsurface metagenome]